MSRIENTSDLLKWLKAANPPPDPQHRLGIVTTLNPLYVSFDGDFDDDGNQVETQVPLASLDAYNPALGDRVVVTRIGSTWLVQGSINTGNAARTMPAGSIIMWGGGAGLPPTGYVTCNGSAVSRTTYANLFAAIGTNYGAGNGTTTFNLPNFQGGKFPSHQTAGQTGGSLTHTHPLSGNGQANVSWGAGGAIKLLRNITAAWTANVRSQDAGAVPLVGDNSALTGGVSLAGDTDAAATLPPWIGVIFVIKV